MKALSYFLIAAAAVHGIIISAMAGYQDYGALGAAIGLISSIVLFPLLPLVGWFFLPTPQMWTLVGTLGLGVLLGLLADRKKAV